MARTQCCVTGVLFALIASAAQAQTAPDVVYAWTNFVGQPGGSGNADGTGSAARFCYPASVAVDSSGNVYVADMDNETIRKVTSSGLVTTMAGLAGSSGSTDGTGSTARFNAPLSVAVDSTGNVYVADSGNNTIRKVTPAGVVTTLAGLAGYWNAGSSDGTGSAARFHGPCGVAVDSGGNVYVGDFINCTIRKVTPSGAVTTMAGLAGSSGSSDGTGSAARFNGPSGVAVDSAGNVYVADRVNNTIRKVTPSGAVTTLAGLAGSSGSSDGTGSAARFNQPWGVAVDSAGTVYVADSGNDTIRQVTASGVVTTLAGLAGSSGSSDGTGSAARFNQPWGVAVDSAGNAYVTDTYNNTIREVTPLGVVTTVAGSAPSPGSTDGTGSAARFVGPRGVAVGDSGDIYVTDSGNYTIRKATPSGMVTTLAGLAGSSGSIDGTGSAARFNSAYGIAVDSAGNVCVADSYNYTIRQVTPAGLVTTLAGQAGSGGRTDGTGSAARFNQPRSVAVDSEGKVYVADTYNNTIRRVTPPGVVTTLAGLAAYWGSADGAGSEARFNSPCGIAVDSAGNVYVADSQNYTIREVTPGGVVTTLAGIPGVSGSTDGASSVATFNGPLGVAVDSEGNVYVADNYTIRRVTPGGLVMTIGGTSGVYGGADGIGCTAKFFWLTGVAVDSAKNLYVADAANNRISKGTPITIPYNPAPGDRVVDLPLGSILSWSGTTAGITFDLYMDTANPPKTKIAAGLTDTTFSPTLTLATRYYWQIVAIHPLGQIPGPVWTFATHVTGDIDGDAADNLADLKLLVAAWNTTPASGNWNRAADLDDDGAVGLADLKILVANWNESV